MRVSTKRNSPRAAASAMPVSAETLEKLCDQGLVLRTFLRLPPERRASITRAAVEEASREGPGQLSIKKVAHHARVPVGSLYQYFGSREALVGFVCAIAAAELAELLTRFGPQLAEMPLAQGLRTYLGEAIAWCKKDATLLRLYVVAAYGLAVRMGTSASQRSADVGADLAVVEPIARAMQEVIRGMVKAAQDRGELREDVVVDDAGRIINILLIAVADAALLPGLNAYYRMYDDSDQLEHMLDATVDLVAKGVLKRGPIRGGAGRANGGKERS